MNEFIWTYYIMKLKTKEKQVSQILNTHFFKNEHSPHTHRGIFIYTLLINVN